MVAKAADELRELCARKEQITELAVDDRIDSEVAPAIMALFHEMPALGDLAGSSPQSEQEIAAHYRKQAGDALEQLDDEEELIIRVTNAATALCGGPLKMRATKAGTTIMATVCDHPSMPKGEQIEPTVIKRT